MIILMNTRTLLILCLLLFLAYLILIIYFFIIIWKQNTKNSKNYYFSLKAIQNIILQKKKNLLSIMILKNIHYFSKIVLNEIMIYFNYLTLLL